MGNYAREVEEVNRKNQLQQFNNQFLKYDTNDTNNVTIHDIVTVTNLAKSNNETYDKDSGYYITVFFNSEEIQEEDDTYLNELLKENINQYKGAVVKYKCRVTIDTKNERVTNVSFTE